MCFLNLHGTKFYRKILYPGISVSNWVKLIPENVKKPESILYNPIQETYRIISKTAYL